MRTPKITLSDFTGINNNGVYFLYGFYPKNINGSRVLIQGMQTEVLNTEEDTGFSAMNPLVDIVDFSYFSTGQTIGIGGSKLYGVNYINTSTSQGLLHSVVSSGTIIGGVGSVATSVTNNHILYTSANNLGVGYYFNAESATSTSVTLEDPVTLVNVNLTTATYGFNATPVAGANKAYNLTKGEEYTITSITNSGSTINFSAASVTPQANDKIIVFNDARFSFGTTNTPSNHFKGQPSPSSWNRNIVSSDFEYWIGNGNYIATLDNLDETTFSATAVQLPAGCNYVWHDINQDQLLIAALSKNNYKLIVYSISSNEIVNEINTNESVIKVRSYKSGWLVLTQNGLFFTGGSALEPIFKFVDFAFNGATAYDFDVYDDKAFISVSASSSYTGRQRAGYYCFDIISKDLVYIKSKASKTLPRFIEVGKMVKVIQGSGFVRIMSSYEDSTTGDAFISQIKSNNNTYCSALFCIKLPTKMKLNEASIDFTRSAIDDFGDSNGTTNVTINYGDGRRKLANYSQTASSGDTSSILTASLNYQYISVEEGDMVEVINGNYAGYRSYISSIADPGTVNQKITVSPSFPAALSNSSLYRIYSIKKSETKTIDLREDTPYNTRFTLKDFNSDVLWIEIYLEATAEPFDIYSINLY